MRTTTTACILVVLLAAGDAFAGTNAPPLTAVMHVTTVKTPAGMEMGEVRIVLGTTTNTFTSKDAICAFLGTLPKETRVFYSAPYAKFHVLVGTNRMHLRDFGRMCRGKNIVFQGIVPDF